jgi:hypothetical protein
VYRFRRGGNEQKREEKKRKLKIRKYDKNSFVEWPFLSKYVIFGSPTTKSKLSSTSGIPIPPIYIIILPIQQASCKRKQACDASASEQIDDALASIIPAI